MAIVNSALTLKDLPTSPEGKIGWPWTEQPEPLPNKMPDGCEWPRISIVTPSYNYGQFIEETIRSVLLQGYPNLEYIIIDADSTDDSVEIIRKYEQYLAYWISEADDGQTDAINKGYQQCTGEIFVWLNADDTYADSNCLKSVSSLYKQGYQLIVGECLNIDENNKLIKITENFNGYSLPQNFDQYLKFWSFVPLPQPSVFIAKALTDKSFPLEKQLYMTMDYQLFLRVLSQHPKSIWVKQSWVKFKYHGKNKTMSFQEEPYSELFKVSLSEAKKEYSFIKMLYFSITAKDYLIIQSLLNINSDSKIANILIYLLYRPSLARWSIFWKIFVKSCIGKKRYSAFKQFVHNSIQ